MHSLTMCIMQNENSKLAKSSDSYWMVGRVVLVVIFYMINCEGGRG